MTSAQFKDAALARGIEEWRDDIFAEIDYLIATGWGDVPRSVIEKSRAKNGGELPARIPRGTWNAGGSGQKRSNAA